MQSMIGFACVWLIFIGSLGACVVSIQAETTRQELVLTYPTGVKLWVGGVGTTVSEQRCRDAAMVRAYRE